MFSITWPADSSEIPKVEDQSLFYSFEKGWRIVHDSTIGSYSDSQVDNPDFCVILLFW